MISQHQKTGFRNPWVLGILALVAVVLAVNGAFIWLSTHNKSTLVDREYKSKDRKAGAEFLIGLGSQQALGWQTTMNRPKLLVLNQPTMYDISVVDRNGNPVSGEMIVESYRAADASQDFSTPFREVSIGNYQGFISYPLKGYWELHIRMRRNDDVYSVRTDRFMVAAAP